MALVVGDRTGERLQPFAGPIVDNEGHAVVPKGAALSDPQILSMNYLVAGVLGKIPK